MKQSPEDHINLLHILATRRRRMGAGGVSYHELISAGYDGLHWACENYDPSRGVKFHQYAMACIWGKMQAALMESGVIITSRGKAQIAFKFRRALQEGATAESLGLQDYVFERRKCMVQALEQESLEDAPESALVFDGYEVREEIDREKIESAMYDAIRNLKSKRNAVILCLHHLQGMTLEEIGSVFSISRERVRQLLLIATKDLSFRAKAHPVLREAYAGMDWSFRQRDAMDWLKRQKASKMPFLLKLKAEREEEKEPVKIIEGEAAVPKHIPAPSARWGWGSEFVKSLDENWKAVKWREVSSTSNPFSATAVVKNAAWRAGLDIEIVTTDELIHARLKPKSESDPNP